MFGLGATVSAVATTSGATHVGGVSRCASVWACPVCAPTIRERRATEIDQGLAAHLQAGGVAYFVTTTVRHTAGTPLAQVLDLVTDSWSAMMRTRAVCRSEVYAGQIRAVEITHGANGWHPHVHALMLFEPGTTEAQVASFFGSLRQAWTHQLSKRGATCNERGFDARPVTSTAGAAGYLSKVQGGWGAGLDVARADLKSAKSSTSTTPFEFLARAAAGETFAAMMWAYYEEATLGRRAIVWSRGLKARLGVDDITDDDAAEETLDGAPVVLAIIPSQHWRRLLRTGEAAPLLNALGMIGSGSSPGDVWRWPHSWLTNP